MIIDLATAPAMHIQKMNYLKQKRYLVIYLPNSAFFIGVDGIWHTFIFDQKQIVRQNRYGYLSWV
ncbi:MAG: hypothetical protein IPN94_06500 [Sphingobacteriales bacterium]|nr:hypothetical protein [Sphingobacteriales bacterium]